MIEEDKGPLSQSKSKKYGSKYGLHGVITGIMDALAKAEVAYLSRV